MLNAYNKYGFLFKRTAISKGLLNQLLSVDAFAQELDLVYNAKEHIDDTVVFNIAKSLLFQMLRGYNGDKLIPTYKEFTRSGGNPDYGVLKNAVGDLSRALLGSRDAWRADYEAWLFAHTNQ